MMLSIRSRARRTKEYMKKTFFSPGNPAIWVQSALIGVRALAVGVALLAIGKILGAAFSDATLPTGWVIAGIAGIIVAALAAYAAVRASGKSQCVESARIRDGLMRHAFGLGPARFRGRETGAMVAMFTDSVEAVTKYRQGYLGQLVGSLLTPLITLGLIAVFVDWLTALILLIAIPFVPLVVGGFQRFFSSDASASRRMRGKLSAQFLEAIQGLSTLVGIGAAQKVGDQLEGVGEDNRQALMKVLARNQLLLFVMESGFSLFLISVAITMSWLRLDAGVIGVGEALAVVLLTSQLTTPINSVGGFFYIGMAGRGGQKAMSAFLQRSAGAGDSADQARADADADADSGAVVTFDDVHFAYGDNPVLRGVDLNVQGATSLLGASGSGKTTLLSIAAGDLVPDQGCVSVNGVALTPASQDLVRAQSAVVQQHTWLFHASLADNLRLARHDATDEELWAALEQVDLREWAESLPEKLATPVGERGMSVSGGQAQRISIARAIVAGRDLIIMDEPTSQVDLESEAVIEQSVEKLAEHATVLMATHRTSMAKGRVLSVIEGKVSE